MIVLKIYQPEISYTLAELSNKFLKEFCFADCSKISSVVPVFKNVVERHAAKNYCPVILFLWFVKSLKNFF